MSQIGNTIQENSRILGELVREKSEHENRYSRHLK